MNYSLLIIFLFLCLKICYPQIEITLPDSSIQQEEIINEILDEQSDDAETEDLSESIEYLINNPIDINTADISRLQLIPFIDFTTANLIINHRTKYGSFFSPNELYSISAIPKETTARIIPFIIVAAEKNKRSVINLNDYPERSFLDQTKIAFRSRVINDLQERKGFKANKFEGSAYKVYNRFSAEYNENIRLGFTAEKDAGEALYTDYSSFHLQLKNYGPLNSFVLGDYIFEWGQGLAMWSPYGFSKSADAVYSGKKKGANVKPYTSTDENNFFRGTALNTSFNNLNLYALFSNNKFDANLDSSSGVILSRSIDGLHRNPNEKRKKNAAEEILYGGGLTYTLNNIIKTGVLFYNSSFSNDFNSSGSFGLKGKSFSYTSFFYDAYYNNLNLFGEFSYNGISVASVNGIQISFSRDFIFVTSLRNYPRNYSNLHGFGFGEQSGKTENEFGIYSGFKLRTWAGILNFYYDQFKFPYSSFDNPLPTSGDEFLIDLSSKPFTAFESKLRFKYERKDVSVNNDNMKSIVKRYRQNSRIELIYNLSRQIRLKGRFDYHLFKINEAGIIEEGYLLFQEIKFAPVPNLNIDGRIIFFQTDSFNSAVYEYENDLTGVMSNPAMFGEGLRWYITARYKPVKNISISMKYSETFKPGEKYLSSGDSEIEGSLDNRFGIQLDFNF